MFLKNFEKTDRRILTGAFIALGLSMFLMLNDSLVERLFTDKYDKLVEIGAVKVSQNDVRRRHQIAFSWNPLARSNEVYQGDSIFTGEDSTAVVVTDQGEEIYIAENSLVVINAREDSITLDIGFGSVEGKVESGKKLLIATNNQVTELTGTDATVKIDAGDGGQLIVNVLEGQVTTKTDQGRKTIGQGGAATIDLEPSVQPSAAATYTIDLVGPVPDQKLKPTDLGEVDFKWKSPLNLVNPTLEIAKDQYFKNSVFKTKAPDFSFTVPDLPKDETLYWRVKAQNGKSLTAPFVVVGDRAPVPTYPQAGTHIYFDENDKSPQKVMNIEMAWEEGSPADRFEVQIARDESFEKIIATLTSQEKRTKSGDLSLGEYFWRVRSIDFPNESWSDVSFFNLSNRPMESILAPTQQIVKRYNIRTKPHRLTVDQMRNVLPSQAFRYMAKIPTITWPKVIGAQAYIIQVSRSRDFRKPLVNQEVSSPRYVWREATPGKFYWRLQVIGPKYTQSPYSAAQPMFVSLSSPVSLTKNLFTEEVPDLTLLNAPPPPFRLRWRPSLFAKNYEIQFSEDPSFKDGLRYITDKNLKVVQARRPGKYFWRVRSIAQNNEPNSKFSPAYEIEFKRNYADPEKMKNLKAIKPAQQETFVLVGQGLTEIKFLWSNPYKGSDYRLQLSSTPDFTEVFHEKLVKNNNKYILRGSKQNGIIYWRVRAENQIFKSPWTGANRFQVALEGQPFDFEMSDKLFQARLKARERQLLLAELIRLRKSKDRSPAATVDIQLGTPAVRSSVNSFTLVSRIPLTTTWRELSQQPYEKFFEQHSGYPTLNWDRVPQAERYVVDIARDPEFKQVVIKYPTTDTTMLWDTVRPGQFYWRVQAFNDNYTRSQFSATQPLYVSTQSPVALSPDIFLEVMDEPQTQWLPPTPFQLEWTPIVFARKYEIEFSNTVTFENRKLFTTNKTSHKFKVSRSGTYYWRVRPINQNGVGVGPYSPIRALEIAQANRTPASVTKVTGVFPSANRTLVYVGEGLMRMVFHWLSPHGKGQYQLELSTTADFSNVIARKTTYRNQMVWSKDLPEGPIFWRVGYGKEGFIREWSEPKKFNFRREKEPYLIDGP